MAHPDIRPKPNNLDVGRSIEEQLAGVRDQVEQPPADKPALGEEETGDVPAPAVVAESAPKPLEPVKEPAPAPAPAEKQKPPEPVRNLDQELGAEIARVGEKIKVLADGSNERIKGQLEAQWKLLEHYKKFSRNPNQTLIDRVQAALEKIRRIEAKAEPRPARVSRTGRGPGPALAKRAAPVGPEPTANPEASAEARESMIKERAAQIRAKREAGGAEANVEVDARITAAGAFSFTPEADAIAAQWDREQAAKQITEEEAQARQAHQEALAQAPTPAPAPGSFEAPPAGEITEERESATRAAAWYTLDRLQNFDEINHSEDGTELKTEQERQARFVELVKKYWAEGLTTHGIYGKEIDPKTSQAKIMPMSDLDGSACLFLLKEAGIDTGRSKINYVRPGKGAETGLVMDTSDQLGVIAENRGKRLTVDHHQEGGRETAAAKMLYELLSNPEIGLLKAEPWLKNFVEFVAHEDNKNYSDAEAEELLENYGRNFVSLADNLGFEEMKKFFQDGTYTVFQALPDEYLEKFKFTFAPLRHQDKRVNAGEVITRKSGYKEASLAAIRELEAGGLVLDTGEERFGRVLIDTGQQNKKGEWKKRVGLDFDAVRPSGYGAYLVWLPEKEQFFLKTVKKIDFELPDGYNVRGHYLLKSNTAGALRVGLRDILAKLAGDDNFEMPDELKAAVEGPAAPEQGTAPDEEIEKAGQAITASYNQAVGDENLRREFRRQYQPVRFGTQNAAARLRDASVPPDFKTLTNGEFWAVPIAGQKNKFVVVPLLGIAIDQAIVYPGAMVQFYVMAGFDRRQRYKNVQVVKPAVFELDEAAQQWKCIQIGELNLIPGPKAAEREETPHAPSREELLATPEPGEPPPPAPAEETEAVEDQRTLEEYREKTPLLIAQTRDRLLERFGGQTIPPEAKRAIRGLWYAGSLIKKEILDKDKRVIKEARAKIEEILREAEALI